jgi:decaprenylphospho-beta-D-erythro-pentofuranosid-2-ulose 2-reductase
MKNGVGVPQNIVLFGGTSEIGQAVVSALLQPGVARLTLVARDVDGAAAFGDSVEGDTEVEVVRFDGADHSSMAAVVEEVSAHGRDIDVAVIAHGVLAEGTDYYADPAAVHGVLAVNTTATAALLYAVAARMRAQGYGRIIVLSSVAGVRVRKGNPVYGASKAAVDSLALAIDHELEGTGVSILIVRPGFVVSKMTTGMKKAPFSSTPGAVARIVAKAANSGSTVVYAPSVLRWVFGIFRVLPQAVWRRLPLG